MATPFQKQLCMDKYNVAESINLEVNSKVQYVPDIDNYGTEEYWVEAIDRGDCEDYALAKRARLLEAGWSLDSLLLCLCRTEDGGYHCVLWVDTDKGGYILDNRYTWPMVPDSLPYTWISILRGGKWYELSGWH